jgi:hypothetical protein
VLFPVSLRSLVFFTLHLHEDLYLLSDVVQNRQAVVFAKAVLLDGELFSLIQIDLTRKDIMRWRSPHSNRIPAVKLQILNGRSPGRACWLTSS